MQCKGGESLRLTGESVQRSNGLRTHFEGLGGVGAAEQTSRPRVRMTPSLGCAGMHARVRARSYSQATLRRPCACE
eukprot:4475591-Pleurochrysis_carterae.AAC.1